MLQGLSPIRTFDKLFMGNPCFNPYNLTIYRYHFRNLPSSSPPPLPSTPSSQCLQSCFEILIWYRIVEIDVKHFFWEGGCSRGVRPSLLLLQIQYDLLHQPRVMNKCGELKRRLFRSIRYLSPHQLLTKHGLCQRR
jgi:hypothetical protein